MDAFVLENVLTSDECRALTGKSEDLGYSFWDPTLRRSDFRSAHTVEVTNQPLADLLWNRIKDHVVSTVSISEEQDRFECDIGGDWVACGINEQLLFARYKEGGHFSPHTDGYTVVDMNTRSLYSSLVYLNTCLEGGHTRLLELRPGQAYELDDLGRYRAPSESIKASVPVKAGDVLFFYQTIVHEGQPVAPGHEKYIIRTDVMYRRTPAICTAPNDIAAFKMMKEAEELEAGGKAMEACELFQKCSKLSPELAQVYGMA